MACHAGKCARERPLSEKKRPPLCFYLKRQVRSGRRAPHVRHRAAVEAEALLGLFEVPPDNVMKVIERNLHVMIERVKVVHVTRRGAIYHLCLRTHSYSA